MDAKNILPATEMQIDMPSAFINCDDDSSEMYLKRENIAEMAFRAVFADKLGTPKMFARMAG